MVAMVSQGVSASCRLTFASGIDVFPVALAHTPAQLAQGLSGRASIEEGMLFVWPDAQERAFWMKNTYQPLKLFYLDEAAVIQQSLWLYPLSEAYRYSEHRARYALELPEAMVKAIELRQGDSLLSVLCH